MSAATGSGNGTAENESGPTYSKGTFRGENGENFYTRAVYTPFSPAASRVFSGDVVAAEPICAETPLRNATRVHGNIVLILRGEVAFDVKMQHAFAAGAKGVIFCNTEDELYLATGTSKHPIPSVVCDHSTYMRLHGRNLIGGQKYVADFDLDRVMGSSQGTAIEDALAQGRICKLEVTVIEGHNLKDMEFLFNMDPYVELRVGTQVPPQPPYSPNQEKIIKVGIPSVILRPAATLLWHGIGGHTCLRKNFKF
jgi:hypothetical protein